MIYDISKHSLESLKKDQRLISSIMREDPTLTESEAVDKIVHAYDKCNHYKKPEPVKIGGDVCPICGSSDLQRTGVCKVCNVCGSSLGCS